VTTPATFVMAGGGSGGHVIPALAVARELRARGHSVRFIGTRRGMESKLVPPEGFPIEWIEIGGLKRVGARKLLASLMELPWSVWEASRMLRRAAPAAVFSTGGFVAGPVLMAAIWSRIPVIAMEPNAVPGFTHRRLARFAARALVSFPETLRWFPKDRAEVTGLPVREEFFAVSPAPLSKPFTVLITGGSQGSRTLNRAAEESWPLLSKPGPDRNAVRLIHQTGAAAFEELAPRFRASGVSGEIHPFLDNMPGAFACAHLVVSRAGMGAVSEIAAAGRPSILVPLPTASDQHQLHNAEALERAGAALLIADGDMTGARLAQEITQLAAEPARLEAMAKAARTFACPGAARRAAEILESFAERRAVGRD
jgi:UDP-N-acetylglucosamine--N-acetylmuramyl-(pentapeptide) pyrophosphoryl-undecaprenol N-acetylglucosamine transferase